jgi:DNA-binding MarR family transcriptional regulator
VSRAEQVAEQLRAVIGPLVRRLRVEASDQAISWAQSSVLKRLDLDGPMTTADLARGELIKPQTMGGLVAELEAAGYVARSEDATDGRRRVVSLTKAGGRVLAERRAKRQSWLAHAIDTQLDAAEQRTLLEALTLLDRIARP